MSIEENSSEAKEEHGKFLIILGLICSVLFPPIGLIIGIHQLIRNRRISSIKTLAIVCIIMSIVIGILYVHSYIDYDNFHHTIHPSKRSIN